MRGFRLGRRRHRRWILAELAAGALWVFLVFALSGSFALWYHVAVMAVGQSMTSFFAVWTVHHDCDRSHQIARILRGKVKNRISFEMFFNLEHQVFRTRASKPSCFISGQPFGRRSPYACHCGWPKWRQRQERLASLGEKGRKSLAES